MDAFQPQPQPPIPEPRAVLDPETIVAFQQIRDDVAIPIPTPQMHRLKVPMTNVEVIFNRILSRPNQEFYIKRWTTTETQLTDDDCFELVQNANESLGDFYTTVGESNLPPIIPVLSALILLTRSIPRLPDIITVLLRDRLAIELGPLHLSQEVVQAVKDITRQESEDSENQLQLLSRIHRDFQRQSVVLQTIQQDVKELNEFFIPAKNIIDGWIKKLIQFKNEHWIVFTTCIVVSVVSFLLGIFAVLRTVFGF